MIRKILKNHLFWLTLIFFIGQTLRFYNLNWDLGNNFHPDERNIAAAVSRIRFFSQMNPEFFAYGSLSIYLYRALGEIMNGLTSSSAWTLSWGHINLIGRFISATASSLSILLTFVLASKIFSARVGTLAALLMAFAPTLIQTSHYGVTESLLMFCVLILTLLSLNLKHTRLANYLLLGLFVGLLMSIKTTALSFLIIPLFAHLIWTKRKEFFKRQILAAMSALIGVSIFIALSPHTILSYDKLIESMNYEFGVVSGTLPVPYTLQFANTTPYIYQLKNLFWQIGPAVIFSIFGLLLISTIIFKKIFTKKSQVANYYSLFTFLIFPISYFLYVGSWHTKFIRYMVPLVPFLLITASWMMLEMQKMQKVLGNIILGFTVAITILWGMAFFSIYTKPQTRVLASKWIYENIPTDSVLYTEHWDDGLPVSINEHNPSLYQTESLTMYDTDNNAKRQYLSEKLSRGDYIVLNSRRLWGTLINLDEKYPVTSLYYKLLFSGKLGYQETVSFSSYPNILGFEINDDASEETFQVYDHPTVRIVENTDKLSQSELYNLLINER